MTERRSTRRICTTWATGRIGRAGFATSPIEQRCKRSTRSSREISQMREHNTPAVAPVASLTAFDGKGHAGDPKVGIKPPAPRPNGIGDLLRDVQYRTFDGLTDGVNNIAIDSPPVPADMYWVLLGASATAAATIPGF